MNRFVRSYIKKITPLSVRNFIREVSKPGFKKKVDALDRSLLKIIKLRKAKGINKLLPKILGDFSKEDEGLLVGYINAFASAVEGVDRDKLFSQTKEMDFRKISREGWLNLYFLAFSNGLIQESLLMRQKAILQAYAWDNRLIAFRAAIDEGDFERASSYLKTLDGYEEQAYYNLNIGNLDEAWKIWRENATLDKSFLDYINGKSVAIVGPAPSDELSGEEIDSYDVVIRTNYMGDKKMLDTNIYGRKTDVSYYNQEHSEIMQYSGEYDFLRYLDYAVFQFDKLSFQKNMIRDKKARIIHKNINFFNGAPSAIPIILFDILHYNPSKVKVFNTNFFLTKDVYRKGYHTSEKKPLRIWARHDMIGQLHFVRNLWRAEKILVDKKCEYVLRLTSEEYTQKMEENHTESPLVFMDNAKINI